MHQKHNSDVMLIEYIHGLVDRLNPVINLIFGQGVFVVFQRGERCHVMHDVVFDGIWNVDAGHAALGALEARMITCTTPNYRRLIFGVLLHETDAPTARRMTFSAHYVLRNLRYLGNVDVGFCR